MISAKLAVKIFFAFAILVFFLVYNLNNKCESPYKYETLSQSKLYRRPIIIAHRIKQRITPGLHLELKASEFYKINGKPNLINIVIEMLARDGYKSKDDPIFIQSFNLDDLIYLRTTLNSTLSLIYLLSDKLDSEHVAYAANYVDGLGPPTDTLVNFTQEGTYLGPSDFYKDARKHNLLLHPWTLRVDAIPSYAKDFDDLLKIFLIDLNVDGVFTDFPDLVYDYMEKNGNFF